MSFVSQFPQKGNTLAAYSDFDCDISGYRAVSNHFSFIKSKAHFTWSRWL